VRALTIVRPGGPDVLEVREVPDPVPGRDEVLVRVRAAALNRADLLQRRGLYPAPPGSPPDIPGLEFAGEVVACGEGVSTLQTGDRVMGIVAGGGQAEKLRLHERLCLKIPPATSFIEAAAIPEAFLTAYDALFLRGRLEPGESVLIHAAASGVGTAAAAIATMAGARVVALSRSADKRRRLQAMGLHRVLDPGDDGVGESIRMALGGEGVDVVLDLVGASTWALNVDVASLRGRIVLVGTMGGAKVEADLGALMRKRLSVIGTVLRSRPLEEKIALVQAFSRTMLPLLATGRLKPVIDRVLPLDEAAAGHAAMEANENFGKIVLRVDA
jgi:putative PIG3 family NAD(P)H quinone oxidoreductase